MASNYEMRLKEQLITENQELYYRDAIGEINMLRQTQMCNQNYRNWNQI